MRLYTFLRSRIILAIFLSTTSFTLTFPKIVQATEPLQRLSTESSLTKIRDAQSFYQQAKALAEEKRYAEAIRLADRSLQLRQEIWGELHKDVLDSLVLTAELNRVSGNSKRSEELFRQALPMSRQIWGEKSSVVASILYSLGVLQLEKGDAEAAEAMLLEALEIRREVMPKNSPYLVASLYSVGIMYAEKSSYTKAESILEEALEIAEEHLDPADYPAVQKISIMLKRLRRLRQQRPTIG